MREAGEGDDHAEGEVLTGEVLTMYQKRAHCGYLYS
jgi:hypothetical protein